MWALRKNLDYAAFVMICLGTLPNLATSIKRGFCERALDSPLRLFHEYAGAHF
jgi:hypothetical protein